MTARQVLFGAGLVGLGAGAVLYFKRQADLLRSMSYRIRNYRIVEGSATKVVITLDFQLINKSEIPFTVTGYDLNFFSNQVYVARFQEENASIDVPAYGGSASIPVRLEFDPRTFKRGLLNNVLDLISGESITILARGKISVKVGLLGFNEVDVNYAYKPLSTDAEKDD